MNRFEMKKAVATQAPRPEISNLVTEYAIEKSALVEVEPPTKKLKRSGDSAGTAKEVSPTLAPKSRPTPEIPRGEGSSRKKEKWVARPRSMGDLCRVKAWVPNEPDMAREIANLLEPVEDNLLKVWWALLSPRHKVWADGADAQMFYRGVLSFPLAKEIYTTPSEVMVDNAAKNLVTADVRKLQDETGPIVVAAAEARASEATTKLDEAQRREAEALEKVKALEKEFHGLKGDLEATQVGRPQQPLLFDLEEDIHPSRIQGRRRRSWIRRLCPVKLPPHVLRGLRSRLLSAGPFVILALSRHLRLGGSVLVGVLDHLRDSRRRSLNQGLEKPGWS
ncbi:hypothetical protein BHM03_00033303 [Ensete ventricosum]|nr:hypothetical protein BHM03_00033303 [Ensete ventricosum]